MDIAYINKFKTKLNFLFPCGIGPKRQHLSFLPAITPACRTPLLHLMTSDTLARWHIEYYYIFIYFLNAYHFYLCLYATPYITINFESIKVPLIFKINTKRPGQNQPSLLHPRTVSFFGGE